MSHDDTGDATADGEGEGDADQGEGDGGNGEPEPNVLEARNSLENEEITDGDLWERQCEIAAQAIHLFMEIDSSGAVQEHTADRPRGFLTETDREYLMRMAGRGPQTSSDRRAQRRIVERSTEAMRDIGLLGATLDANARVEIVSNIDYTELERAAFFISIMCNKWIAHRTAEGMNDRSEYDIEEAPR